MRNVLPSTVSDSGSPGMSPMMHHALCTGSLTPAPHFSPVRPVSVAYSPQGMEVFDSVAESLESHPAAVAVATFEHHIKVGGM